MDSDDLKVIIVLVLVVLALSGISYGAYLYGQKSTQCALTVTTLPETIRCEEPTRCPEPEVKQCQEQEPVQCPVCPVCEVLKPVVVSYSGRNKDVYLNLNTQLTFNGNVVKVLSGSNTAEDVIITVNSERYRFRVNQTLKVTKDTWIKVTRIDVMNIPKPDIGVNIMIYKR